MSNLDKLLRAYAPPPVPENLAERASAAASQKPQEPRRWTVWRRRDRRGGWKRPLLAGGAALGLAFTSAVAATVASGGRIDIPVVRDVVAAVPILNVKPPERERDVVVATPRPETPAAASEDPVSPAGAGKPRVVQVLARLKQGVEERRGAGLPTPRADRIERNARTIVDRREAAGLPTPPVEQVEAHLALRELRRAQVRAIIERLPPDKRARFERLSPAEKRWVIARHLRRLERRRAFAAEAEPTPAPAAPAGEGNPEAAR